jgi:spore coat polysaccharide biosynthesis predicted glycosyltransferase SpsG
MNRINEPTIVFRCDGNGVDECGNYHINRCLKLALSLRERFRISSRFIIRDLSSEPQRLLKNRFVVHLLPPVEAWEQSALKIVNRIDPELTVIDMGDNGERFLELLHENRPELTTMVLDSSGGSLDRADYSINALIDNPRAACNGPEYAIVETGDQSPQVVRKSSREILICLNDQEGEQTVLKALESVIELKSPLDVTVLVNDGFNDSEKLLRIASNRLSGRLDIIKGTSNIGYFLKKTDVGIVSGDPIMFEAMHCGLPSIVLNRDREQLRYSEKFQSRGAVINLGLVSQVERTKLTKALDMLVDNYPRRLALSRKAVKLVDGQGLRRLTEIINMLVTQKESSKRDSAVKKAAANPRMRMRV